MLPVLILHIDPDYQITYWIMGEKTKAVTPINLAQAVQLLKNVAFDLIVAEPMNLAILRPSSEGEWTDPISSAEGRPGTLQGDTPPSSG